MRHRILSTSILLGLFFTSAISATRADYLLEVDYGTNTINRIDPLGNVSPFITSHLDSPLGMAIGANGNIYVTNNGVGASTINTVSEFDSNGNYIGSFGSGQLNAPQGIVTDSFGNVYVANASSTIDKYSANGTFLGEIATGGSAGLNNPYGIAIDSNNNLYVANYGNNTVQEINSVSGAVIASTSALLNGPTGITVGPDGNIYVSNYSKATSNPVDQVVEFNPSLTTATQFLNSNTSNILGPVGLTFQSSTGNLFVVNNYSNSIEEFSSNGTDLGTFATGLNSPTFIVFQTVPEPASFAMMAIGMTGILAYNRYCVANRSRKA